MKPFIFIFSALLAINIVGLAQCDKKVLLTASETTYLDSNGSVKRTVPEKSVVQINKSEVSINVNDEHKNTATIKSTTCNWSVPFKQGKSVIKAVFSDEQGVNKNVTIEIEGKDGKITLLVHIEGRPDNVIKVVINKFEEEA